MNELNRIVKLFTEMHHGDCWLGVNFKTARHGLQAEMTSKVTIENSNSKKTIKLLNY